MTYVVKSLLLGIALVLLFAALVASYHTSVAEVAGMTIADHALKFCPNWLVGLVTGAFAVGLVWWAWSSR